MSDSRNFARLFETSWGQVLARVALHYTGRDHRHAEPQLIVGMWFDEIPGEYRCLKLLGDPFDNLAALTPEEVEKLAADCVEGAALWVGGVDGEPSEDDDDPEKDAE